MFRYIAKPELLIPWRRAGNRRRVEAAINVFLIWNADAFGGPTLRHAACPDWELALLFWVLTEEHHGPDVCYAAYSNDQPVGVLVKWIPILHVIEDERAPAFNLLPKGL